MSDEPDDPREITALDVHVGAQLRKRRLSLGLTQQQVAKMIGVTYQQAHKYEHGVNRISCGRLYEIAQALNVSIDYFFEGIDRPSYQETDKERKILELIKNFQKIADMKYAVILSLVVRLLADSREEDHIQS